jgi:hypothetical protein
MPSMILRPDGMAYLNKQRLPSHRQRRCAVPGCRRSVSMGGMQDFPTTLAHLNTFASIGGFSGSGGTFDLKTAANGVYSDAAAFNKKVELLWLGAGTKESPNTKRFSEALTNYSIKNAYFESPGTAHEWLTMRRHLNDLVPRLFRRGTRLERRGLVTHQRWRECFPNVRKRIGATI